MFFSIISPIGWLTVPSTIKACVGDNVKFNWQYNDQIASEVDGVFIAKIGDKIQSIVKRAGDQTVTNEQVKTIGNAGMILMDAQESQSGRYECSVFFTNGLQLHSTAQLTVKGRPTYTLFLIHFFLSNCYIRKLIICTIFIFISQNAELSNR